MEKKTLNHKVHDFSHIPFLHNIKKITDLSKISFEDFVPKRFGLKYDPPTIILEYLVKSTGKLYHHSMKIIHLTADSKINDIIKFLKKKHMVYFASKKIPDAQLSGILI